MISRKLGGRGARPRRRNYHQLVTFRPLKDQVMSSMAQPGAQGGMAAVEIDLDHERAELVRTASAPSVPDADMAWEIRPDFQATKRAITSVKTRRQCPP